MNQNITCGVLIARLNDSDEFELFVVKDGECVDDSPLSTDDKYSIINAMNDVLKFMLTKWAGVDVKSELEKRMGGFDGKK